MFYKLICFVFGHTLKPIEVSEDSVLGTAMGDDFLIEVKRTCSRCNQRVENNYLVTGHADQFSSDGANYHDRTTTFKTQCDF